MTKYTQKILCLVLAFFSYTNAYAGSPIIWGGTQATNLQTGGLVSRGTLSLKNLSGSQPLLELYEDPDNGTNKVTLQSTATLAADYTLTLPVDDGTSGQLLATDGSGVLSWATSTAYQFVLVRDQKAASTQGGTFTTGAWQTRVLQTSDNPFSVAWFSLSSNQITLTAGTYLFEATLPAANGVTLHAGRLQNVTDATTTLSGSSAVTNTLAGDSLSVINGVFTIAGTKTFEVQHQGNATVASTGFGQANGFSDFSIYTQCKITKIN